MHLKDSVTITYSHIKEMNDIITVQSNADLSESICNAFGCALHYVYKQMKLDGINNCNKINVLFLKSFEFQIEKDPTDDVYYGMFCRFIFYDI